MLAISILVFTIMLAPIVFVVWVAFFDSVFLSFPPPGYTLNWFAEAAKYKAFQGGFVTSLLLALCASLLSVTIGAPASLAIARGRFLGREAVNALLLSPLVVPNIVLGIALYIFFIWMADRSGIDVSRSIAGLVVAHTLLTLPWTVRLITASVQGMDKYSRTCR